MYLITVHALVGKTIFATLWVLSALKGQLCQKMLMTLVLSIAAQVGAPHFHKTDSILLLVFIACPQMLAESGERVQNAPSDYPNHVSIFVVGMLTLAFCSKQNTASHKCGYREITMFKLDLEARLAHISCAVSCSNKCSLTVKSLQAFIRL